MKRGQSAKKSLHEYKNRPDGKKQVAAGPVEAPSAVPDFKVPAPVHGEVVKGKKKKAIALHKSHQIYQVAKMAASFEPGASEEVGDAVSPGVMQSLIDPLAIYTFKLTTQSGFSSSAGGTLYQYITFDPTAATEYTYLSNLFDLVRVKEAKLTLTNVNPHADGYATGYVKTVLYVACDSARTAAAPSNIQAVIDCPNILTMPLGSSKAHVIWYKAPKDLNWATTSAPTPGPYAGCYGEWMLATNSLSFSQSYVSYLSEIVYEFTSRT
jgi:hypothetical protein